MGFLSTKLSRSLFNLNPLNFRRVHPLHRLPAPSRCSLRSYIDWSTLCEGSIDDETLGVFFHLVKETWTSLSISFFVLPLTAPSTSLARRYALLFFTAYDSYIHEFCWMCGWLSCTNLRSPLSIYTIFRVSSCGQANSRLNGWFYLDSTSTELNTAGECTCSTVDLQLRCCGFYDNTSALLKSR